MIPGKLGPKMPGHLDQGLAASVILKAVQAQNLIDVNRDYDRLDEFKGVASERFDHLELPFGRLESRLAADLPFRAEAKQKTICLIRVIGVITLLKTRDLAAKADDQLDHPW
jgi:hypothetical protein